MQSSRLRAAFFLEERVLFKATFLLVLSALIWLGLALNLRAETCCASFYGYESGRITASGERFRPGGLTAAHRTLPFGARLLVSANRRSVTVRVNDRGPFIRGRCLDLSQGAASALGLARAGVGVVRITRRG
ncbi:septal ring lytic transglycosylase RlpA family protein [Methylocapsa polymorpha]|uniref:Endolytic peptidoglycan transglycosylase RlpA n=1 Tax=Methylocapsa polymorpha TaxID=3080828 RepID=A0ABZ0HNU3_9HYPH|nr:septal ring lytic transglycosylase RlpA family protein [Methylocapsa sp. RX1]